MQIIKKTNINFTNKINLSIIFSGTIILAGLISLALNGGPKLSIDFKGGTMIAVNYDKEIDIDLFRSNLSNVIISGQRYDLSNSEIKHFGSKSNVSLRIPILENEPENFTTLFIDFLKKVTPDNIPINENDFILSIEKVGPKIGSELSSKAIMAILTSLTLILIYVSIRFEFKYAIGAIAALTHDVIFTLGIFSMLGYEISLAVIAAFLTIVGYSLNDTIIIFDRIRENAKKVKNITSHNIINQSINESLSRTIITSLTTFFVVMILYLFGGEVIHNFAFAMIIGVLIGTYSSVYIASAVLLRFKSS